VAGLPLADIRAPLAELTRAHLVTETGRGRVGYHELLRAYAMELSDRQDSAEERRAVRHRFLDHYLHTGYAAALLVNPARDPMELADPVDGVVAEEFGDRDAALAWFTAERPVLLSIADREADGFDRYSWQLGQVMHQVLNVCGQWHDNLRVQRYALRAAQRIDDRIGQACAHRALGQVHAALEQFADAQHHSRAALDLYDRLGDERRMAYAHLDLCVITARSGAPRDAVRHAEDAYQLSLSADNPCGQATAANNMAWLYGMLGDHSAAMTYGREAMTIFEELGDLGNLAEAWTSLGDVYFNMGRPDAAHDCYQQAFGVFRQIGDRCGEARAYASLGDAHQQAGNHAAARRAWQRAAAILDDLGHDGAANVRLRLNTATGPTANGRRSQAGTR
jgi:tetratricopeptide (TPR) repeat protein